MKKVDKVFDLNDNTSDINCVNCRLIIVSDLSVLNVRFWVI